MKIVGSKNNKGIALLLALVIMAVLFTLSTAYLSSMLSESGIARNQESGEKAFFIAESGIDRAVRAIVETPSTDDMPWTLTETMTDGYYAVTAAEAVDIGDDYVRITSIGYCNNASRITELVVYLCGWKYLLLSMSDINFSVTSTGKS
ncbi:MAG: PilX N-terminal domain-containing pilus assembly protein, partial [Candidatus Omnitrophica bacterium]|nr:PilX N-terminal domain-containing pilus assembly protein [Candidatus Omnitrophota bacterium]